MEIKFKRTEKELFIIFRSRQESAMGRETSKGRYIDVVNQGNNCLAVVFVPMNLTLGTIRCSKRATPLHNARLIEAIVKAYQVYMREVYGV